MSNYKPLTTPIKVGLKLSKFKELESINPTLYKQLIKSLIYLTLTQPGIMYVVSVVFRFMHELKEKH